MGLALRAKSWNAFCVGEDLTRFRETKPDRQAQALNQLVAPVAADGDHDRARALATDAETIARTITDPHERAQALTDLAAVVATAVAAAAHRRARIRSTLMASHRSIPSASASCERAAIPSLR